MTCDSWLMTRPVTTYNSWLVTWLMTWLMTSDLWPMTCHLCNSWFLTPDSWHDSRLDSWLITCDLTRDLWLMTSDLWSTCDSWHVTYELWPLIQDLRLATHDMTHDLWLMVHHLSNHDLWLIIWTLIITQFITALTARPTHQVVNSKIQFSLVWKFWIDKDSCEIWLAQVSCRTILGTNMLEHFWHNPDHLWCSDSCCN